MPFDLENVERWVNRARTAQSAASFIDGTANLIDIPGTSVLLLHDVRDLLCEDLRGALWRGHNPDDLEVYDIDDPIWSVEEDETLDPNPFAR